MSLIVRTRDALQRGCCVNNSTVEHYGAIASKKIVVQSIWPFEAFDGADLNHNNDRSSALTLRSPTLNALVALRFPNSVASLFDEQPLEQLKPDIFPFEFFPGHDAPLSNSRTCSNKAISLLAGWLVESTDTSGTRGIPEISSHLEAVTREK